VSSPTNNLTAIVLDIGGHILYKPVVIKKDEIDKRSFLNLSFANKGLDGINLIKDQSVPIISYAYTMHVATTIFSNKHVLFEFGFVTWVTKHELY
jgi:hypothetical protein